MAIQRVKTLSNRQSVPDFSDFEFDSGFAGVYQHIQIGYKIVLHYLKRALAAIFTSFLGLHYIYVITWAFVLSWIIYPQRNISYTDALFQAVSAVSLSGLNTVNINDLKLYQQLFLFIVPVFTHPLTVASFMVHYRLYLYKKKFDGIEENSKQQSKLRRHATLQRFESQKPRDFGPNAHPAAINLQLGVNLSYPEKNRDTSFKYHNDNSSVASHTKGEDTSNTNSHRIEEEEPNKIRFGDLPRPPDRHQFDPSEMFRSLNMMRNQIGDDDMDEDDGPALVIKSPRDIEADEKRGIHSAVADRRPVNVPNTSAEDSFDMSHRRFSHSEAGRHHRKLSRADTVMTMASANTPKPMTANYLSWTPTVGHNSTFIGLTQQQKEELGGVEYRALKMLRWITLGYFIGVLCTAWLMIIPWVYERNTYRDIILSHGVSPGLFGVTTVLSAFNNSGLCVLPSSLAEFWHSAYVPVIISFTILAGNVATPIFLRVIIWILFKLSPQFGQARETLGFLLDHPRLCFMLLFPKTTTLWLSAVLLLFIVVEVSLFMILNRGVHSPQPNMSEGPRLLCAYFQSITIRTVGFSIIDIPGQHPAMIVLNTIMMYIGIYPVAMSIRKSNVYEEQTLGRYYSEEPRRQSSLRFGSSMSINSNVIDDAVSENFENPNTPNNGNYQNSAPNNNNADNSDINPRSNNDPSNGQININRPFSLRRLSGLSNRIRNDEQNKQDDSYEEDDYADDESPSTLVDHMRRQLSMDICVLFLGILLIAITEGGSLTRHTFSLFAVVYEIVSAHGAVGISTGYADTTLSLSGGFSNLGKLIMMAIMIRARHRGMPYNVDRAIILKGADIVRRDREQEHRTRDARLMSYSEPSPTWFPRVATTASRLTNFGTVRRRSTTASQAYSPREDS